ncbi:MAG: hypothetical protein DRN20_03155, partial [Thermoplasmata archaeon]
FDAITRDEEIMMLTAVSKHERGIIRRAKAVRAFSDVVGKDSVIFVEKCRRITVEGMPVISRDELKSVCNKERLVELIIERRDG